MSNETDAETININSSIDSHNLENNKSRISSASSKKYSQELSDFIHNSHQNTDQLNNQNQSIDNSFNHEEQITINRRSRPPSHIGNSNNVHTNDNENLSISKSAQSKKHDSIPNHPSCTFVADKKWLDRQYHENKSEHIKKPDELENEMEDPEGELDPKILDRIQGSIIGLALGDALGAHVEFRPYEYVNENPVTDLVGGGTWGLDKGQFTDDTSMALCLANSLLARKDFIPYDQLVRYKWWSKDGYMSSTGQCFDIGAATSQSIYEFEIRQKDFAEKKGLSFDQIDKLSDWKLLNEFDVYCSEDDVAGNGALMRLAPVPLFFFRNKYAAIEFSGRSGEITHGDKKAYDACRFYGALIVAALKGYTKKQILAKNFYSEHRKWFGEQPLHPDIIAIAEGSFKRKGGYEDGIRGKGYIVNALEAALWAFWSDENSFEKGALAAVNLGDDTDTTAAIYGQLAGAYYGYKQLPSHWLEHIYAHKFMTTLSKWIAYEGEQWNKNQQGSFTNRE